MNSLSDDVIGDAIGTHTETYMEQVVTAVDLVRELLERYHTGTDIEERVSTIRSLESDCDRTNRRLGALVTNATVEDLGLLNTRVHFSRAQVIELYHAIDAVPNAAERVADELVTIKPQLQSGYVDGFRNMADCARTAVEALERAIAQFVALLRTPTASGSIVEEIQTIRDAEGRSDSRRNELIATAFADDSVTEPLVYRELAYRFDAIVNAIEDVTDRLVLISSTESWIRTEPNRNRPPTA